MSTAFTLSGIQTFVSTSIPEFFLNTVPAKFQRARDAFHSDSIQQKTNRIVVGILILAVIVAVGLFRWQARSQPKVNLLPNRGGNGAGTETPIDDANSASSAGGSGSNVISPLPDPDLSSNLASTGQDQGQLGWNLDEIDLNFAPPPRAHQPPPGSSQGSSSSTESAPASSTETHSDASAPGSASLLDPLPDDQPEVLQSEEDVEPESRHLQNPDALTLDGPSDGEEGDSNYNDDGDLLEGWRPPEAEIQSPTQSWWDTGTRLASRAKSNFWYYAGY